MMLDTVCYLAIVGIQEEPPDGGPQGTPSTYRVHLSSGHGGSVSKEEFDHLREYLQMKNRIELARTRHHDPKRDSDIENDALIEELKKRVGDDGC